MISYDKPLCISVLRFFRQQAERRTGLSPWTAARDCRSSLFQDRERANDE